MADHVKIAAVGDIHIGADSQGKLSQMLSEINSEATSLVLCGDLTDQGLISEAEVLLKELESCRVPIVAVLGNHDYENGKQEQIKHMLLQTGVHVLDGSSVEIDGIGYAGIKGFCGGFGSHMLQAWGEEIIKQFVYETVNDTLRFEKAISTLRTEKKIGVLHYAPIRATVEGEASEIMSFLGSSRMVEPIDRFQLTAVFHGHAHGGTHEGKTEKEIPVYNVSLPIMAKKDPQKPYRLLEL